MDDLIEDEGEEILSDWLAAVERVPRERYVALPSDAALSYRVYADSYRWCNAFFTDPANPYGETVRAKRSFHAANVDTLDFLRHEYAVHGMRLEVVESRMFTRIQILSGAVLPDSERPHEIHRIAGMILKGPEVGHAWTFRFPKTLQEGGRFSTDPSKHPMDLNWTERADGGIRDGLLWFLCYKRAQEVVGYRNPQSWFDDEFRARWRR